MLTSAEVISSPDVDSAFSTERVIACDAAARSTMTPFLIPSEGSMPTPRMRTDLSSSTRPTNVQTFVVPTSMPTTISSILLTHPVIGRSRIRHIDHCRTNASLRQRIHHRFIHTNFQFHIVGTCPKIDFPATRIIPAKTKLWIINNYHTGRDMSRQSFDRLHHLGRDIRRWVHRINGAQVHDRSCIRYDRNQLWHTLTRTKGNAVFRNQGKAASLLPADDRMSLHEIDGNNVRQRDVHVCRNQLREIETQTCLQIGG